MTCNPIVPILHVVPQRPCDAQPRLIAGDAGEEA